MPAKPPITAADSPVTQSDLNRLKTDLLSEIRTLIGQADERLLRLDEVEKKTGYKRPSIYNKVREGTFPAPVDLGGRATAWRQSDIEQWIAQRATIQPGQRRMPSPNQRNRATRRNAEAQEQYSIANGAAK